MESLREQLNILIRTMRSDDKFVTIQILGLSYWVLDIEYFVYEIGASNPSYVFVNVGFVLDGKGLMDDVSLRMSIPEFRVLETSIRHAHVTWQHPF